MCYSDESVRGDRTKDSQMSQGTLQMFYVQCMLIRWWCSYVANYSSLHQEKGRVCTMLVCIKTRFRPCALAVSTETLRTTLTLVFSAGYIFHVTKWIIFFFFSLHVDLWVFWWLNCKSGSLCLMHGSIHLAVSTFLVFCILWGVLVFLTTVHLNYF